MITSGINIVDKLCVNTICAVAPLTIPLIIAILLVINPVIC